VAARVQQAFDAQELWPEPLVQLNPAFAPGASVPDLVKADKLHALCADVFRHGKSESEHGAPLDLYKHQVEAIDIARGGDNYVVTTGTGSGKSLTYIIPIVDHVLRHGSGKGIKAIIVYPMNALANSQAGELEKFLGFGFGGTPPVTYHRYTGQDDEETRRRIKENPPDILLTNYECSSSSSRAATTRRWCRPRRACGTGFDVLHTYAGAGCGRVHAHSAACATAWAGPTCSASAPSATMGSPWHPRAARGVARVDTRCRCRGEARTWSGRHSGASRPPSTDGASLPARLPLAARRGDSRQQAVRRLCADRCARGWSRPSACAWTKARARSCGRRHNTSPARKASPQGSSSSRGFPVAVPKRRCSACSRPGSSHRRYRLARALLTPPRAAYKAGVEDVRLCTGRCAALRARRPHLTHQPDRSKNIK